MRQRPGTSGGPPPPGTNAPPAPPPGQSSVPLARRFTIRYVAVLVAILAVAVTSHLLVSQDLDRVASANDRAALAAGQPNRVHRIAELAERVDRSLAAGDAAQVDAQAREIAAVTEELRNVQHQLVGDAGDQASREQPLDERSDELFLGGGRLDQRLSAYASSAQLFVQAVERGGLDDPERAVHLERITGQGPQLVADLEGALVGLTQEVDEAVRDQRTDSNRLLVLRVAFVAVCGLLVFRPMARSIRVETSALEAAEARHRASSERQSFQTALKQALELCNDDQEVIATTERALVEILEDQPADVLLEDSAGSSLYRAGSHALRGAAGCPVDSPDECAALRSGQTRLYPSSRQINVCPKLPMHDTAPCSAVCIPMVVNGDGVGVLHVVDADGTLPEETTLERLAVLSEEVGARLGTLRITRATRRMAERDALTDLDNRRTLLDKAQRIIAQHRDFSLAMADLDHFKALNDTHGHEQGDRSLRLFADVLSTHLRPEDVAARYGGEEFVVILPGTSVLEASAILERLGEALAEQIHLRNAVPFTASWGLTDAGEGDPGIQSLLNDADEALYEAKRAGRNRVAVHPAAAARLRRVGDPFATARAPADPT